MSKLEISYIPISEIVPYSKNPRKNDKAVDVVAKSIQNFGFKNPIILDKNNEKAPENAISPLIKVIKRIQNKIESVIYLLNKYMFLRVLMGK